MSSRREPPQRIPAWQRAIRDRCAHSSGPYVPFEREEIEQTVTARFHKMAAAHGSRVAVDAGTTRVSYAELSRQSHEIAAAIHAIDVDRATPVLHLLEPGAPAVAAVLGILESGNPLVPLDHTQPVARLGQIVRDTTAQLIVTNGHCEAEAAALAGDWIRVLNIDRVSNGVSGASAMPHVAVDDIAWIIYTSGSTGLPKGVIQTHRNVLQFMRNYCHYFRISPDDRLSNLFSFSTHAGAYGLLLPLTLGATLSLLDLRSTGPEYLAEWIEAHQISVACMVPTVFRRFANAISPRSAFPDLRLLYLAGEPLLRTDFQLYRDRLPQHCVLVNRLGSTETDCIRLFFADHETTIATATVPAGYPVRDKIVHLLDEHDHPVAPGTIGEIVVHSPYVSPGYWRRPDLTAAATATIPNGRGYRTGDLGRLHADGCLEHQGRKDFQVKIRGYRVEIAEVENALLSLPGIGDAAVIAEAREPGDLRLTGYIVPSADSRLSPSELRSALAELLPAYMVPARFCFLAALPHRPNGKVDRRALPDSGSHRPSSDTPVVAPRTSGERMIARIWAEVLGLGSVGVHDHFLDLGGDSVAAMQVLARVNAQADTNISFGELMDRATVAELGRLLEDEGERRRRPGSDFR